jgi:VanZ family protein
MSSVTMGPEELPRYRTAWFALGWLLVLGVAVGSLLPSLPEVSAGVSDKFMHFAAYATLAFLFMGAVGRRHWRRIALGLLALGAAIELAQATLTATRSGEWLDMAANAAGAAAGLVAAAAIPGNWCRQVEILAGIGGRR